MFRFKLQSVLDYWDAEASRYCELVRIANVEEKLLANRIGDLEGELRKDAERICRQAFCSDGASSSLQEHMIFREQRRLHLGELQGELEVQRLRKEELQMQLQAAMCKQKALQRLRDKQALAWQNQLEKKAQRTVDEWATSTYGCGTV